MFLINSRLGLFTAATFQWLPFSRSYGVILPSSLTRVLPFVLEFSSRLPVSVCGTGTSRLFSGFSRQRGFVHFASLVRSPSALRFSDRRTSLSAYASPWTHFSIRALELSSCVTASYSVCRRYGILNPLSITYAFRPRLRSRLTLGGRTFPRKPQTFDGEVSRLPLATYAGILSSMQSTASSDTASARIHCSSTNILSIFPSFGVMFEPR